MNKIRTTIGVAALVVSTAACTPNQVAYWQHRIDAAKATADPADDAKVISDLKTIPPPPNTDCKEWFWHAIEAGFTPGEWINPVSWIMERESRCFPGAHNPSGAAGLMQEMPMWAAACGGTVEDLYDPLFNLHCAVHIHDVSGWGAWSTYG